MWDVFKENFCHRPLRGEWCQQSAGLWLQSWAGTLKPQVTLGLCTSAGEDAEAPVPLWLLPELSLAWLLVLVFGGVLLCASYYPNHRHQALSEVTSIHPSIHPSIYSPTQSYTQQIFLETPAPTRYSRSWGYSREHKRQESDISGA